MPSRWRQLNGLVAALLLVLMGAAWLALAPAQLGGQSTYVIVNGNSMEPVLAYGDLVILRTADEYQVGDIVTYRHPQVGTVIHRIIGRDGEHYIFRGDHNSWTDSYHPDRAALLGKLWLQIPAAGRVIGIVRSPLNLALLVFIINTFAKMMWKEIGFCRSVGSSQRTTTKGDKSRCPLFYHSCSASNLR